MARALRNAQRQRRRLKRKAKNLSTDDLVEVLTMRVAAQKAKAGTASVTIDKMIKMAKKLDELGLYEITDKMFHF